MKKTPRTELFETFAIQGLTLRDYFAAKALTGLVTNSELGVETNVKYAYYYADAMIERRKEDVT